MLSRRCLLASGFAALPLAARNRIDRSRVSVITDEIARGPRDAIDFAKQYGLQWVELRGVPGMRGRDYASLPEEDLRAAAQQFREHGLRVSFLNTSLLKIALPGTMPARWVKDPPESRDKRLANDAARFERRLDELRRGLRAAHILGATKMRVFSGWRVDDPVSLFPRLADILNEMGEIAAKEKVHLLVENEAACNIATCRELAGLFERLPSPWLGINWDPDNGGAHKEPPFPEGYRLLPRGRLGNVQIKGRSILPGMRPLDWAAIFGALVKDGYKGQVGLETHIFGDMQIQASHDSMQAILRLAA